MYKVPSGDALDVDVIQLKGFLYWNNTHPMSCDWRTLSSTIRLLGCDDAQYRRRGQPSVARQGLS